MITTAELAVDRPDVSNAEWECPVHREQCGSGISSVGQAPALPVGDHVREREFFSRCWAVLAG